MTDEPRTYPLVIELVKRSRLKWNRVMLIVAALLILILVLFAYLDGAFTDLSYWEFWRNFLDGPVLVIYILLIYPIVWRLWLQAVETLHGLLSEDNGVLNKAQKENPLPARRWEWVSIIVGVVFWLALWQPWTDSWRSGIIWLSTYNLITQILLFGLLAWLIFITITSNRYINRLSHNNLSVDLFETSMLSPIARSSLGFSLAFIGGISLNLVFQSREDLLMWNNILVWVLLVCFIVALFFLSMWSIHNVMAKAKKKELEWIKKNLKESTLELKQRVFEEKLVDVSAISSTMNFWMNYERRIKETTDWPFNPSILRRLAASIAAPVAVFFIKVLPGLGIGT